MKNIPHVALSAILFSALTIYGVSAIAQSSASSPGSSSYFGAKNHIPDFEQRVIASLELTPEQKAEYDKLQIENEKRLAEFYAFRGTRSESRAKGLELNKWWNAELKRVFGAEKYAMYCKAWEHPKPRNAKPKPLNFEASEKAILAKLKLTPLQEAQIEDLEIRMRKENDELKRLWRGDDADAIVRKSSEINKLQNGEMKRILGDEKYAQYKALWRVAMGDAVENAHPGIKLRPMPGFEENAPRTGKVGG